MAAYRIWQRDNIQIYKELKKLDIKNAEIIELKMRKRSKQMIVNGGISNGEKHFFFIWDSVSLCSPDYIGTHSVDQAGLELTEIRLSPPILVGHCLLNAGVK